MTNYFVNSAVQVFNTKKTKHTMHSVFIWWYYKLIRGHNSITHKCKTWCPWLHITVHIIHAPNDEGSAAATKFQNHTFKTLFIPTTIMTLELRAKDENSWDLLMWETIFRKIRFWKSSTSIWRLYLHIEWSGYKSCKTNADVITIFKMLTQPNLFLDNSLAWWV